MNLLFLSLTCHPVPDGAFGPIVSVNSTQLCWAVCDILRDRACPALTQAAAGVAELLLQIAESLPEKSSFLDHLALVRAAFAICAKVYGLDSNETSLQYDVLGMFFNKYQMWPQALKAFQRSLAYSLAHPVSCDQHIYGVRLMDVGAMNLHLGNTALSKTYTHKSLQVLLKIDRPRQAALSRNFTQLALVFLRFEDPEPAIVAARRNLEIVTESIGTNTIEYVRALELMYHTLSGASRWDDALEFLRLAVEARDRNNMPDLVTAYRTCAAYFQDHGRKRDAAKLYERALILSNLEHPHQPHLDKTEIMQELVILYIGLGRIAEGRVLGDKLTDMCRQLGIDEEREESKENARRRIFQAIKEGTGR
eukprot:TRINITY_DN5728_c0_g1_i2.p1 TRINITY_DN5728_c0_g1~~TRINITY_DN5728_c0_g1_i2.p1  ORF type:complete len:365 (-),score=72.57 TRINITY_DN5728_c0_g1_i2:122-1216(-)